MKLAERSGFVELEKLKKNVAQNIFYLRNANNMTQSELGAYLNYSDKTISKWERAEGLPDVYVLTKLSEKFGVSVDYFLEEHSDQDRCVETQPIQNAKSLLTKVVLASIIVVAVLVSVILHLTIDVFYWQLFVYILPAICIVQIVFSALWWHGKWAVHYTSALVWTIIATIYVALLQYNCWQLFLVGIPAQIVVFLCYKMGFAIAIVQKTSVLFKRKTAKKVTQEFYHSKEEQ